MKAKCQKEPDNDSLNAILQKLKTALDDLQSNGFLSVNLSGLSRPYLEACSDYLNSVLQDFEQFDNYTYFVKTVSFLNASDCTFENNVVHFFNSLDDDHCHYYLFRSHAVSCKNRKTFYLKRTLINFQRSFCVILLVEQSFKLSQLDIYTK